MFFRNIGLTLALSSVLAFAAAALVYNPGEQAEVAIQGKRQDRLVPAGGFKHRQHSDFGFGANAPLKG
ncbi:MAG TPA: hypothetical protein PKW21_07050 [Rhabdaerophilum sp.]|nr:hypothetical protein [Rhabdaerophilum sp.]